MSKMTSFPHCLLPCLVYLLVRSPLISGVKFNELADNPKVEFGSPVGTYVTTVTAWKTQGSDKNDNPITYRLFKSQDAAYFTIDSTTGDISTQKIIDRKVNGTFRIILEAVSGPNADKKMIYVSVTQPKNRFQPQFQKEIYTATLDLDTPIGAAILQALAFDDDTNSSVRYSIEPVPGISDPSVASFQIDPFNGTITLKEPVRIGAKNVTFVVVARDTGEPPKESRATATIAVSYISEPRNVTIHSIQSTLVTVCWREPETGNPEDFRLRYHQVRDSKDKIEILEQVFALMDKTEKPEEIEATTLSITATVNPGEETTPFLCGNVTGLKSSSTYNLQIFGQKGKEVGRSSAVVTFSTLDFCSGINCNNGRCEDRENDPSFACICDEGFTGQFCQLKDPCTENPCQNQGICKSILNDYQCECQPGFYGKSCEFFNPCSLEPCKNNGKCSNVSNNNYFCECTSGFAGTNCTDIMDPCTNNPCLNEGTCINQDGKLSCVCPKGFSGSICDQDIDECLSQPCVKGTCINTQGSFTCSCDPGYSGSLCEVDIDECSSSPCLNNAVCQDGVNSFKCHCRPGFDGILCEMDKDDCYPNPCQNGGSCTDKTNDFDCHCQPGYFGPVCQFQDQCPDEVIETKKGKFHWSSVGHGEIAQHSCPHGSDASASAKQRVSTVLKFDSSGDSKILSKRSAQLQQQSRNPSRRHGALKDAEFRKQLPSGSWALTRRLNQEEKMKYGLNGTIYAVRSCEILPNGTTVWMPQDDSLCRDERSAEAEKLSNQLESLTESWTAVNAEEIQKAAEQIESLVQYAVKDPRVAQSMMNVLSNMLDVSDEILGSGNSAGKLLDAVDRYTQNVNLKPDQSISLTTPNIAIETTLFNTGTRSKESQEFSYSFKPNFGPQRSRRTSKEANSAPLENLVSITIPKEALESATGSDGSVRLQFVSFRNSKLFRGTEDIKGKPGIVLSATLGNSSVSGLKQPVTYSVPFSQDSTFYSCVYWNETKKTWSTSGIATNVSSEEILCSSNHLTAFSVLLDPTPVTATPRIHRQIQSIISYVGSGCSVLGLTITVFMYSLFRNLRRDRGGKILLNLCFSLLLLNISYLISATSKTDPELLEPFFSQDDGRVWVPGLGNHEPQDTGTLCITTAVALHYLVLSSLAWMLVEAANMYQLLITVFARSETCFMVKRMAAAWGIPLIIVAVTAQINLNHYNSSDTECCRVSPSYPIAFYVSFFGPICLILLLNLVVFAMVMRVILQQGRRGKAVGKVGCTGPSRLVTAAQVRGAITVMALLGISWVFGALAIGEIRIVMQYLFCITNSFQGFIIFVVRVVQYPEARMACLNFLRTGKIKTRYEGTRNSTGPTTHSSSGHHFQVRSTMSSSTNSGSQSRKLQGRSSSNHPSSSNDNREFSSISDVPTLPADARNWYHAPEQPSPTSTETKSVKEHGSFRKNVRRIFNQFRLEPSLLKSRDFLKNRSMGPHALLERHVSGATNPPPSPGEKPHQMNIESIDCEDLAKPNFAIGEEITLLSSHEKIGYFPGDDPVSPSTLKLQDSMTVIKSDPDVSTVTKRLSGLSSLTMENSSRRSSVAKEGANTSWTFLRPDGSLGPSDIDSTVSRPRCRSIPFINNGTAGSLVTRRATSAHQLLPRIVLKSETNDPVKEKKSSCPTISSYNDLLQPKEYSLERKFMSMGEINLPKKQERENSFVMIAGRRVALSRTPSKVEA